MTVAVDDLTMEKVRSYFFSPLMIRMIHDSGSSLRFSKDWCLARFFLVKESFSNLQIRLRLSSAGAMAPVAPALTWALFCV